MGVPMGNAGGHSGHQIYVYKPPNLLDGSPRRAKMITKAPMATYAEAKADLRRLA